MGQWDGEGGPAQTSHPGWMARVGLQGLLFPEKVTHGEASGGGGGGHLLGIGPVSWKPRPGPPSPCFLTRSRSPA